LTELAGDYAPAMTADDRIARRAPPWLLAGPAVFLGAVLLGFVSNALVDIGPFERATFGWAIVVPLLLAAPLAAGLVGRGMDPGLARGGILVASVLVGIGAVALLVVTTDHVGCSGPLAPIERVRVAAPVGLVAAAAYGLPGWIALRMRAGAIVASVIALAAGVVAWFGFLFALVIAYGVGASCAYVP